MAVFQIVWSEGDPVLVEGDDFADALFGFWHYLNSDPDEEPISREQATKWIDGINQVGDTIVGKNGRRLVEIE